MPPSTRLLVVRHGESEWNAVGRWQGQADPPLTDTGVRQAAAAAERLGMFDAIWTSTLQRASLTAEIIAETLGLGPVIRDRRLQETHFGPWQGLTMPEVEAGWPGFLAEHRRPDGAESWEEVTERAMTALRDISAAHCGGEVLVITHAGVIRTLRRVLLGADRRFPNLGGAWFTVAADGAIAFGEEVALVAPEPDPGRESAPGEADADVL